MHGWLTTSRSLPQQNALQGRFPLSCSSRELVKVSKKGAAGNSSSMLDPSEEPLAAVCCRVSLDRPYVSDAA